MPEYLYSISQLIDSHRAGVHQKPQLLADPKKYRQNDSIDNSWLVEVRGSYPPTKHTEGDDSSSGHLRMSKKTLKPSYSREAGAT
jgi:hypothetical protein